MASDVQVVGPALAGTATSTQCCIAGGGPAGMMLGLLFARAGIDVLVLEKHADFLRDFRGDTIHPSTLELMHELGLLERFLARPHQEAAVLGGQIGDMYVTLGDFRHLSTRCKFIALMPQWEFLDFIAKEARRYPGFKLWMRSEVSELIHENDRVAGVRVETADGPREVRAQVTIGADGRHSTVRGLAGLEMIEIGVPIDVLWFRVPKPAGSAQQTMGRIDAGSFLVMLDRDDYWQCAFVIPKDGYDLLQNAGLESFRSRLAHLAPALTSGLPSLQSWDDVKLLSVAVNRARTWCRNGLLCIGDAAHAMSPVGGVGINLAIQDAVATANLISAALRAGRPSLKDLGAVQARREFPTRMTQRLQVFVQERVLTKVLAEKGVLKLPAPVKFMLWFMQRTSLLQRLPARVLGLGFRPEHIRCPALVTPSDA